MINRNEKKKVKLKSFYTTMDTCHNHTNKGCGGSEGLRANAREAIPMYKELFENCSVKID